MSLKDLAPEILAADDAFTNRQSAPGIFNIEEQFEEDLPYQCLRCLEWTDLNDPCCPIQSVIFFKESK